jgi:hypothetical protein
VGLLGEPRARRTAAVLAGFAAVLGIHAALCVHWGAHGSMGADEGLHALAAREAWDGRLPYRDFAYTRMPLLPYVNGLFARLAGDGMLIHRALGSIWGALGLVALILALRQRLGRWEPGFAAAFCVAANPHWAALQSAGAANGAAGLFLTLCAGSVLTTYPLRRRLWAFSIFAALCLGVRLSAAPPVAVLWLGLVLEAGGWRARARAAMIPAAVVAIALLPFFLASPRNALFDVWQYHLASTLDRQNLGNWVQWWQTSPAPLLLLLAGMAAIPRLLSRGDRTPVIALAAGLAGVLVPMIPRSAHGLCIAPAAGLAAAVGVVATWSILEDRPSPFRHVVWLLPLLVLYYDLPKTEPHRADAPVEELAVRLNESAGPGPVLTPLSIVAVEAGREVLPGTEMGMFCAMAPANRALAARLGLVTLADMGEALERRAPAAVVLHRGRSKWNFEWAVPTMRGQPKRELAAFREALRENYEVSFGNDLGVIWLPR